MIAKEEKPKIKILLKEIKYRLSSGNALITILTD